MRRRGSVALAACLAVVGSLAAPASASTDPAGTRAVVRDARGDASGSSREVRRLADLRRVSYRTPSTRGGTLTVRASWSELRGPRRPSSQTLVVFVDARTTDSDQGFAFVAPRTPVGFYYFPEGSTEPRRVSPDSLELNRTFGRHGRTRVTVSTEWLEAQQVTVNAVSFADTEGPDFGSGFDNTTARTLRVGPRP